MDKKDTKNLTRQEELDLLRSRVEEARKNPEIAAAMVRASGIYEADGQLKKRYRDPRTSS